MLINGGLEVPPDLNGFTTVVDFVDAWSEPLLIGIAFILVGLSDIVTAIRVRREIKNEWAINPQYLGEK